MAKLKFEKEIKREAAYWCVMVRKERAHRRFIHVGGKGLRTVTDVKIKITKLITWGS